MTLACRVQQKTIGRGENSAPSERLVVDGEVEEDAWADHGCSRLEAASSGSQPTMPEGVLHGRLQPRGRSRKASDQRRSSENIRACSWPDADAQNISADDGGRTENEVGVAREKRRSEGDMGEMNGRDACGRWREATTRRGLASLAAVGSCSLSTTIGSR